MGWAGQINGGLRVTVFRAVVRHTMRRAPGGFLCKGEARCAACLGRGQTQYGSGQTMWVMGGVLFRVWLCMVWVGLVSGSRSGGEARPKAGLESKVGPSLGVGLGTGAGPGQMWGQNQCQKHQEGQARIRHGVRDEAGPSDLAQVLGAGKGPRSCSGICRWAGGKWRLGGSCCPS